MSTSDEKLYRAKDIVNSLNTLLGLLYAIPDHDQGYIRAFETMRDVFAGESTAIPIPAYTDK